MEFTYFGHSAFQIKTGGTTILLDPFITGNPLAESVVRAEDLNPDVILVTHAHVDHWGDTVEIAQRTGAQVVSNFDITSYLTRTTGYENVQPMNTGGSWAFSWGRLIMTYARHSSVFQDGASGGNPNGFIIHADGHCVYAAGDTAPFSEMAWIGDEHDVDLALLPIGDCFTMGPRESLRAVKMLQPAVTIPIHYDTFPLIEVDMDAWQGMMNDSGFSSRVLRPGGTFVMT